VEFVMVLMLEQWSERMVLEGLQLEVVLKRFCPFIPHR